MPRISNTFYRIQKAQGKIFFHGAIAPDSPWTFFFRERDWEWTNICTFLNMAQYLVAWLRLPFSREVVIWTVPGYTFIERWKTFDAKIWSKKNMHTQWEKEKRWVIEIYMPNWWNSDEVKRLVFFFSLLLLFWTVCYFILLKWAKINRIHAMKVLSIY